MPAETFADLLDVELARVAEESATAPAAAAEQPRTVTVSPLPAFRSFVPFDIPLLVRPSANRRTALAGPRATLTAGETCARLALESPAISSMDFSQAELRSAFRQLAREHHPDRHPEASAAETTQWSGSFAAVERRYRKLAADLAARH